MEKPTVELGMPSLVENIYSSPFNHATQLHTLLKELIRACDQGAQRKNRIITILGNVFQNYQQKLPQSYNELKSEDLFQLVCFNTLLLLRPILLMNMTVLGDNTYIELRNAYYDFFGTSWNYKQEKKNKQALIRDLENKPLSYLLHNRDEETVSIYIQSIIALCSQETMNQALQTCLATLIEDPRTILPILTPQLLASEPYKTKAKECVTDIILDLIEFRMTAAEKTVNFTVAKEEFIKLAANEMLTDEMKQELEYAQLGCTIVPIYNMRNIHTLNLEKGTYILFQDRSGQLILQKSLERGWETVKPAALEQYKTTSQAAQHLTRISQQLLNMHPPLQANYLDGRIVCLRRLNRTDLRYTNVRQWFADVHHLLGIIQRTPHVHNQALMNQLAELYLKCLEVEKKDKDIQEQLRTEILKPFFAKLSDEKADKKTKDFFQTLLILPLLTDTRSRNSQDMKEAAVTNAAKFKSAISKLESLVTPSSGFFQTIRLSVRNNPLELKLELKKGLCDQAIKKFKKQPRGSRLNSSIMQIITRFLAVIQLDKEHPNLYANAFFTLCNSLITDAPMIKHPLLYQELFQLFRASTPKLPGTINTQFRAILKSHFIQIIDKNIQPAARQTFYIFFGLNTQEIRNLEEEKSNKKQSSHKNTVTQATHTEFQKIDNIIKQEEKDFKKNKGAESESAKTKATEAIRKAKASKKRHPAILIKQMVERQFAIHYHIQVINEQTKTLQQTMPKQLQSLIPHSLTFCNNSLFLNIDVDDNTTTENFVEAMCSIVKIIYSSPFRNSAVKYYKQVMPIQDEILSSINSNREALTSNFTRLTWLAKTFFGQQKYLSQQVVLLCAAIDQHYLYPTLSSLVNRMSFYTEDLNETKSNPRKWRSRLITPVPRRKQSKFSHLKPRKISFSLKQKNTQSKNQHKQNQLQVTPFFAPPPIQTPQEPSNEQQIQQHHQTQQHHHMPVVQQPISVMHQQFLHATTVTMLKTCLSNAIFTMRNIGENNQDYFIAFPDNNTALQCKLLMNIHTELGYKVCNKSPNSYQYVIASDNASVFLGKSTSVFHIQLIIDDYRYLKRLTTQSEYETLPLLRTAWKSMVRHEISENQQYVKLFFNHHNAQVEDQHLNYFITALSELGMPINGFDHVFPQTISTFIRKACMDSSLEIIATDFSKIKEYVTDKSQNTEHPPTQLLPIQQQHSQNNVQPQHHHIPRDVIIVNHTKEILKTILSNCIFMMANVPTQHQNYFVVFPDDKTASLFLNSMNILCAFNENICRYSPHYQHYHKSQESAHCYPQKNILVFKIELFEHDYKFLKQLMNNSNHYSQLLNDSCQYIADHAIHPDEMNVQLGFMRVENRTDRTRSCLIKFITALSELHMPISGYDYIFPEEIDLFINNVCLVWVNETRYKTIHVTTNDLLQIEKLGGVTILKNEQQREEIEVLALKSECDEILSPRGRRLKKDRTSQEQLEKLFDEVGIDTPPVTPVKNESQDVLQTDNSNSQSLSQDGEQSDSEESSSDHYDLPSDPEEFLSKYQQYQHELSQIQQTDEDSEISKIQLELAKLKEQLQQNVASSESDYSTDGKSNDSTETIHFQFFEDTPISDDSQDPTSNSAKVEEKPSDSQFSQ